MLSRSKNPEEENFLVSSADLMACVLFVFILLAVVFAMRARQTEAGLRDQQRKWGDTSKARSTLLEGLRSALISNGVRVTINEEGDGLFFPEGTLRFAQCSSKLRVEDQTTLGIVARELAPKLEPYAYHCGPSGLVSTRDELKVDVILVEGHTDRRPPAPGCGYQDNWELSAARATATRDALLAANPNLDLFCNGQSRPLFAIAGYAAQRPVRADASDDENRRIELRIVMRPPALESAASSQR